MTDEDEYEYFDNWQTDGAFRTSSTLHKVEDVDGPDVLTECGRELRSDPTKTHLYGADDDFDPGDVPDHRTCGHCFDL